jgi:hypothetical protein
MSKANIRQWILMASTAVGFGALGWGLGQASRVSGPPPAVAHDDTPPPHTLFATGPLVAVAKDGRVTLHVDHESLSWVLAEIDRQAGAPVTAMDAAPKAAARGPAVAQQPPASEPAARSDDVLARVLRGTEPERYDALKTLYQTDASPRVRLLAFEDAQEATEGDPAARRLELEAARLLPDAVVAEAAARRLEALDRQAREAAPQDAAQR